MKRILIGKIISTKMEKSAVIRVDRLKEHPLYRKKYRANTKLIAENPNNMYHKGDIVKIIETKPLSAKKHWLVKEKIITNKDSKKE